VGKECHKCKSENPDTSAFCADCGTKLPPLEDATLTKKITKEATLISKLTTGSTFGGRYQVIEELGKGGMGKVYKVIDKEINIKVALKLINPEISTDKKTIERFRNELKVARDITHKNICRMYDLNKEKSSYYITMEYIDGEDLKGLIRKVGQLPIGKTVSVAKQISEGLVEAHKRGIIHRDLKSNNIMIDREGNARIMDFGIARSMKSKSITGSGVMIGTPEYMSPEQSEAKKLDQRSDIYSLGVILYEMVTGLLPFEGDTPLSIAMKHKGETPKNPRELNSQIPESMNQFILRCIEKEREKRFQTAEEVRDELKKIEEEVPTTDRVIPKRKPLTSREITVQLNLKKLFIPALTFIVLVIVAVIIWQVIFRKETLAAPKIDNSIAVISFENQTGSEAYDYLQRAIPNLLITNLEQTGSLYVVTWDRMHDLLKQIGKNDVETINRNLGFELCRIEGIESIVLGSFIKAGDTFATDIKVLDVETKELLKTASSKGRGVDSILETQIDELSDEISEGLGIARKEVESVRDFTSEIGGSSFISKGREISEGIRNARDWAESAPMRITDVTTSSMEAYNDFLRGREEYEKFYYDDARKLLEKAVSLDPNFAIAYLYLAWTYRGLDSSNAYREAIEKAKAYSAEATEKERLYIEAHYAKEAEGNPKKSIRIFGSMAAKYPKEKRVYYDLAWLYWNNDPKKAIEEFENALELDPNYSMAIVYLAYIYFDILEDYEKANELLERYSRVSPSDADTFDSLAEFYFRMGRLDDSIAKYKEGLKIKPDYHYSFSGLVYVYALKENYQESIKWIDQLINISPYPGIKARGYLLRGFYSYWMGKWNQSIADLNRVISLDDGEGNHYRRLWAEWLKGWIYYEKGDYASSEKCYKNWFNSLVELGSDSQFLRARYAFSLGLIELKRAQLDSAKSKLNEIERLVPNRDVIDYALLFGEAMLAENQPRKVIPVFKKKAPIKPPWLGADPSDAIFYNIPFIKRDVLARAYKKNGDIDKAIVEYERLTTFDPNSKDRRLIHPRYHYRLADLYHIKSLNEKAIEQYSKFLRLWENADPGMEEVDDAKERLAELKRP